VFLASLFADSANLDDLFSSNYVLHDDDQVCSNASCIPQDQCPDVPQSSKVPEKNVQIVIDQDSPGLASDPLGPPPAIVSLFVVDEQVATTGYSSSDPFYLLHCTLLI